MPIMRLVMPNMVCVAGAISAEARAQAVESHFGGVARGRLAPVRACRAGAAGARREDIEGDYKVCRGAIG